jgi:hypothetical protein
MTTYGGSSDFSRDFSLRPGSRSSTDVSIKSEPVERSAVEASAPEGYEDVPIYSFPGIQGLRKLVRSRTDELQAGDTTEEYLIFQDVTKDCLAEIDRQRASIGKHIRMTHYTDTGLLIIKIPLKLHETAHGSLGERINFKVVGMGLPIGSLVYLGAGTCKSPYSSKEGDTSYKPQCRTGTDDWPTIVIEAGLSESLRQLRADARWWLTKCGGEVKIIILIGIIRERKSLQIEQWCMAPSPTPRPTTRTHPNPLLPLQVPTPIQELTVIHDPPIPPLPGSIPTYTVAGAPLTFDFAKILLRAPVPPEGNIIFTAADLQAWAQWFWSVHD